MLLFSYLAAILLHECGHMTALVLFHARIKRLSVSPFGLTISHTPLSSFYQSFAVAASGPLFGVIGYIVSHHSSSLPLFSQISLLLSLFNLLPIATLDGSRMLSSLLESRFSPDTSERITSAVSSLTLALLWLIGAYLFFFLDLGATLFLMALTLFFQKLKNDSQEIDT